jgi:hypothetical protein
MHETSTITERSVLADLTSTRALGSAGERRCTATDTPRQSTPAANLDKRIAAHASWSRTRNRSARTQPARDAFLARFEREVDPDGTLPADQRRQRAEHALRAYMLRLAKRSAEARKRRRPD